MRLFYHASLLPEAKHVTLSEEDSRHSIKVLRLKQGDAIHLIDGKGGLFKGLIEAAHPKKCEVQLSNYTLKDTPKNHRIHMAIAPTKNMDRTEWFLEKAVEIGIDEVSFITTKNSERKVLKMERLEKIAIAAMKQSLHYTLPILNPLQQYSQFLEKEIQGEKFMAYTPSNAEDSLIKNALPSKEYCILIGPEGGFTPEEASSAQNNNFQCVSLGNSRLRTETAGVVACSILNMING